MADEASGWLLRRFVSAVQPVLPLVSVWAHGSLAGGDYQAGRSDLDLIAILGRPCTAAEEQQLGEVHESLGSAIALASRLHCSYCTAGSWMILHACTSPGRTRSSCAGQSPR